MNPVFKHTAIALAALGVLSGCATTYQCKAPDGLRCMSVSEVYDRHARGLPMVSDPADVPHASPAAAAETHATKIAAGPPGEPIYRAPRVLRVWFADWEDADGIYYRNHYVLMRLDQGEWIPPEIRVRYTDETP